MGNRYVISLQFYPYSQGSLTDEHRLNGCNEVVLKTSNVHTTLVAGFVMQEHRSIASLSVSTQVRQEVTVTETLPGTLPLPLFVFFMEARPSGEKTLYNYVFVFKQVPYVT